MIRPVFKYLFISLLATLPSASFAGINPEMDPAPADRSTYQYKREPGQLKHTKYGMIDPSPDVISLQFLPKDKYGFVDWMKALDDGVIIPRDSFPGARPLEEPKDVPDVLIKAKQDFMPDVIFPHSAHSKWLKCSNCHPKIFAEKAGKTPISMVGIWKGQFCGRCHDRIAFPTRNCFRCHSAPKTYKKTGEGDASKDANWSSREERYPRQGRKPGK